MQRFLLIIFLSAIAAPQEDADKEFIELYLKIQSLEKDIATLRNENEALSALNAFVQTNSDSDDTPLAYFWMGEINLTNGNLAVATQNYNTLVGLYPTHWKVPLAKFKLGTIYLEQGSKERAVALLESVIRQYPDSSAAKASAETLSSLE